METKWKSRIVKLFFIKYFRALISNKRLNLAENSLFTDDKRVNTIKKEVEDKIFNLDIPKTKLNENNYHTFKFILPSETFSEISLDSIAIRQNEVSQELKLEEEVYVNNEKSDSSSEVALDNIDGLLNSESDIDISISEISSFNK